MVSRKLVVVMCAVLALFAAPLGASADETVDSLAESLGIHDEPTDYIVVVDTSLSMASEGRWERAREALAGLLRNLRSEDYVTLITFDDGARTDFAGHVPADPGQLLNELPAAPTGDQTDIGTAIDEAVGALEREGANSVTAVALITDGRLDPAAASLYQDAQSPAWDSLRSRADQLRQGRHVGAFALSLGGQTDAGLLTSVFPDATVASPNDIVGYLTGLDEEIKSGRVTEALAADLAATPTMTVTADQVEGPVATFTATITSPAKHVPLQISGVQLQPAVEGATLDPIAGPVDVAPGTTVTIPLRVTLPEAGEYNVAVAATLTSPWAGQLAQLGVAAPETITHEAVAVTVAPRATAAPATTQPPAAEPVAPEPSIELPTWWLSALLGLAGLAVLSLVVARVVISKRPQLDGSVTVVKEGEIVDEFMLAGRKFDQKSGEIRLRALPVKGEDAITISGVSAGQSFNGKLGDGETLATSGGVELHYTSVRSRMLELVNTNMTPSGV
jgi:hypothetical protein